MSNPIWEKKCWGEVCHLFAGDFAGVSYLRTIRGYRCSRHRHNERTNHFAVVSGILEIQEWDNAGNLSWVILQAGESYTVPSGVLHRFKTMSGGEVIEVYWPDVPDGRVRMDDIVRLDEGGVDE